MFERLQNKCNRFHLYVIGGLNSKLISSTYRRSFKVKLTWSTNKVNMKIEELSKEVRHKVAEKHRSGEGYKKISKSLIIPLSTVEKRIIPLRLYTDQVTHPNSAAKQVGSWFGMSLQI